MADVVDRATRSRMMAGIKGKDTKPELLVRSGLHRRGYRFRLHDKSLPGKPDLLFRSRKAVIFVHGCFWHGHNCSLFKWPSTRAEWWRDKINGNRERDREVRAKISQMGWRQARVWECSLKGKNRLNPDEVVDGLANWLDGGDAEYEIGGR